MSLGKKVKYRHSGICFSGVLLLNKPFNSHQYAIATNKVPIASFNDLKMRKIIDYTYLLTGIKGFH